MSSNLLEDWLHWWIGGHLRVVILVVDIVANTDELAVVVRAGEEDDGNADDVGRWDASGIWGGGLEDELVDADWDWTDEKGVELLVVLSGLGGADVDELPLKVCGKRSVNVSDGIQEMKIGAVFSRLEMHCYAERGGEAVMYVPF